jgi:uncharacterized protein YbjT (DUF2867 family)
VVSDFLDQAERAGVRNVTYLSAYGMEDAPGPERHAGRAYAPTGPESLTLDEAAKIISAAAGRTIVYRDTDRDEWVDAMVRSGVPADYGEILRTLTETIASGLGSQPNGDVLAATGAAPISFAEFAAKTAPAWK